MDVSRKCLRTLTTTFTLVAMLAIAGCQFLPQLAYMGGGSLVDAEYDGLQGKRVAIICVSDSSSYGSGSEGKQLAQQVGHILSNNVDDVEIVSASEVADWVDRNGWDEIDYREVGQGVKADRVVAIDLEGFNLKQGPTLFKGQAALSITVFDLTENGKQVYHREMPNISYPATGVYSTSETTESTFQQIFLKVLASRCARLFYEFDGLEAFKPDPAII